MKPSTGLGPTVSAVATSMTAPVNGTSTITFRVPPTLVLSSPTLYDITVTAMSTSNVNFGSSNRLNFTVQPAPVITQVAPTAANPGTVIPVTITGKLTSFRQGATLLSFGPGTIVNGGPVGGPGLASVVSPQELRATVRILAGAANGVRTVTAQTGSEIAISNSFRVGAGEVVSSVVLTSPTNPATAVTGATVSVSGTGFPQGAIVNGSATVTISAVGGTATATAPVTAIVPATGAQRTLSFAVPVSLNPSATTQYLVTVQGRAANNQQFASTNTALLTVTPGPRVIGYDRGSMSSNELVTIRITTTGTNFVQGQTTANFGAGLSVGGAPGRRVRSGDGGESDDGESNGAEFVCSQRVAHGNSADGHAGCTVSVLCSWPQRESFRRANFIRAKPHRSSFPL